MADATANASGNLAILVATTILTVLLAVIFITGPIFIFLRCYFPEGCCGRGGGGGSQRGGGSSRRTAGLSRAVIETLPTYLYSDVKVHRLGNGELECAVCLNEFKDVEILRLLPSCCHVFHPDCIDTWLASRATCPVCRADVGCFSNLGGFEDMMITTHETSINVIDIEQPPLMPIKRSPEISQVFGPDRKSHSTGHSPAWTADDTDRFTLRLPEEVRGKLARRGGRSGLELALMRSPKSWYRTRVVGWCKKGNKPERSSEPGVLTGGVSCFSSPQSDGPVDYSTLVKSDQL